VKRRLKGPLANDCASSDEDWIPAKRKWTYGY